MLKKIFEMPVMEAQLVFKLRKHMRRPSHNLI